MLQYLFALSILGPALQGFMASAELDWYYYCIEDGGGTGTTRIFDNTRVYANGNPGPDGVTPELCRQIAVGERNDLRNDPEDTAYYEAYYLVYFHECYWGNATDFQRDIVEVLETRCEYACWADPLYYCGGNGASEAGALYRYWDPGK